MFIVYSKLIYVRERLIFTRKQNLRKNVHIDILYIVLPKEEIRCVFDYI